jgi:hypothetical protein
VAWRFFVSFSGRRLLYDATFVVLYLNFIPYHWRYRWLLTLVIDTVSLHSKHLRSNHNLNAVLHNSSHLRHHRKEMQMERAEIIN